MIFYGLFWAANLAAVLGGCSHARNLNIRICFYCFICFFSNPFTKNFTRTEDLWVGCWRQNVARRILGRPHQGFVLKCWEEFIIHLLSNKVGNIEWVIQICAWYLKALRGSEKLTREEAKLAGATQKSTWQFLITVWARLNTFFCGIRMICLSFTREQFGKRSKKFV